ncbi:phage/plasmid primase, P4 family [Rhodoblastus sp.]|uniref:phage/plasmid primase, P4 family n=1 Tax=Rhodoblastus sp. TaxID=1962975 RepID=UPI003F966544
MGRVRTPVPAVNSKNEPGVFDECSIEYSDDDLALRFADRHAKDLRYVAAWNRWLLWDGKRWHTDKTIAVINLVRKVSREAAAECGNTSRSIYLTSMHGINAIERLARADRRLAATVAQWDSDPLLLNTPAGVIDLCTGQLRPQCAEDYITRITSAAPGGDCPLFRKFLNEITGDDPELIAYLQRVFGYCLTGSTREHALFFFHGGGANGKSVLLGTIAGILDEYHKTAAIETFTASNSDRHPTDMAGMQGARVVTATETEQGRFWAEARIKQLTGGDAVSARFMRQDFWEFIPAFKLIVAGNHKPHLRTVDEAIRRRLHMVPFDVTIPIATRDKKLPEKLKSEWPGILKWMIEGCLAWQRTGLQSARAVERATVEYLTAEDALGLWIEDKCQRDPNAWASSGELFASWKNWALAAGEPSGTQMAFKPSLERHGFKAHPKSQARGFAGLRLKESEKSNREGQ